MGFHPRMLFTLGVILVAACAVYTARDWPSGTGLFPRFVGIPVLALAIAQLALEAYQSQRGAKKKGVDTGDLQVDWSMSHGLVARRAAAYFGWLIALFLGIWVLGFFVAIPVFCFVYLKLQAKEGWLLSASLTLSMYVFFLGLFDQVLHVAWLVPLVPGPENFIKSLLPFLE